MTRGSAALAALTLTLLVAPPSASAATESAPQVVLIRADDQRADNDRLWRALAAQLSGMPVRLVAYRVPTLPARSVAQVALGREVATRRSALAVFWVDMSLYGQSGTLHLFIAGKRRDRVLIRGVDARVDDRFEALALIARTAVRALLSGGKIGVELPPRPARLSVRVGYLLGVTGSDGARSLHHTASIELSLRLGPIQLCAGGAFGSAISASERANRVETRPLPLWLGVRWPYAFARGRLVIAPSAVLAADLNNVSVVAAAGYDEHGEGLHLGLYVLPSVMVAWRATARVGLFVDAGAAIYVRQQRYVVGSSSAEPDVALAPWRVQPRVRLGLVVSIL